MPEVSPTRLQRFNLADIPLTRPVILEVARRLQELQIAASVHFLRTDHTVEFDIERGLWVIDHEMRQAEVRCLACRHHTALRYEFLVEDLEGVFHGPLGSTCLFRRALGSQEMAFRLGRSLESALKRSLKEAHALAHHRLLREAGNFRAYLHRLDLGWVIEAALVGSSLLPAGLRAELLRLLDRQTILTELLYSALVDLSDLRRARMRAAETPVLPSYRAQLKVRVPHDLSPRSPEVSSVAPVQVTPFSPPQLPLTREALEHAGVWPLMEDLSALPVNDVLGRYDLTLEQVHEFLADVQAGHRPPKWLRRKVQAWCSLEWHSQPRAKRASKLLTLDPAEALLAGVRPIPIKPAAVKHDPFEDWLAQRGVGKAVKAWRLVRPFTPPKLQKAIKKALDARVPLSQDQTDKLLLAHSTYRAISQNPELVRRHINYLNRREVLRRLQGDVELTDEQAQLLLRAYLEGLRGADKAHPGQAGQS